MEKYGIVVIGASAGGLNALEELLSNLEGELTVPIVIVQHLSPDSGDSVLTLLKKYSSTEIIEPIDKESIANNKIYLAPADYHLMIESDKSFCIYLGPKENFCRPAIDVLFETAAEVYKERTLGIILTGANKDGTKGCARIKKFRGTVIAQDPDEAIVSIMPKGAIDEGVTDHIMKISDIVTFLNNAVME